MKRVAFIGPSLPVEDRGAYAGRIELRPPARKGDLIDAMRDGAEVIGLADGLFEYSPSVWHKEILYCISRGVIVAGAASMGALRAAECDRYGMIGIGAIYDDFRSGRRNADADVAVLHAPAELGHAALTLALVDVDATADAMLAAGRIDETEANALRDTARRLHFRDRSWRTLLAEVEKLGTCRPDLAKRVRSDAVGQKRLDCLALLDFIASVQRQDLPPPPAFELQPSAFLTGLLAASGRTRSGSAGT